MRYGGRQTRGCVESHSDGDLRPLTCNHMSHGQNSSSGDYIGTVQAPYEGAPRLYLRSFDHGSYGAILTCVPP